MGAFTRCRQIQKQVDDACQVFDVEVKKLAG